MDERPPIRYAKAGDVSIAYRVLGGGPIDLVWVHGLAGNVEVDWESPFLVQLYERLASFSRLVIFDKRGVGLSDRNVGAPTLEARMDDVRAVMDAAWTISLGSATTKVLRDVGSHHNPGAPSSISGGPTSGRDPAQIRRACLRHHIRAPGSVRVLDIGHRLWACVKT